MGFGPNGKRWGSSKGTRLSVRKCFFNFGVKWLATKDFFETSSYFLWKIGFVVTEIFRCV